ASARASCSRAKRAGRFGGGARRFGGEPDPALERVEDARQIAWPMQPCHWVEALHELGILEHLAALRHVEAHRAHEYRLALKHPAVTSDASILAAIGAQQLRM